MRNIPQEDGADNCGMNPEQKNESPKGGWYRMPDAIHNFAATIGPYGIVVYAVLLKHANRDGCCWPSIRRIAEQAGMSPRSVDMTLPKLVEAGLISIEHSAGYRSNAYTILPIPAGENSAPRAQLSDENSAPRAQRTAHHVRTNQTQ